MAGFFKSNSSIEQQDNELIVTVIPCGVDSNDSTNEEREKPFEIQLETNGKLYEYVTESGENSLKQIFLNKKELWQTIFKHHMTDEKQPSFSVYRRPINFGSFYQGNNYRKF